MPVNTQQRDHFRQVALAHLGGVLTPEVLAELEMAAHWEPENAIDVHQFAPQTCGRLTFRAEHLVDILDEIAPLHEAHYRETEGYHRGIPLRPNIAAALADERRGRLLQLTARHDGRLVGNFRLYVTDSRHTSRLIAVEDTIYLLPEYRIGRNGLRFVQYMEACVRLLGVSEVYLDDKVANPAAGKLLQHLGYTHVANRRHKLLEDAHVRT